MDSLWIRAARADTHAMRTSSLPAWASVRERLKKEQVNPYDAAISHLADDGQTQLAGILVTRSGKIIDFSIMWGFNPRTQRQHAPDEGWVFHWRELKPEEIGKIFGEAADTAKAILAEDG